MEFRKIEQPHCDAVIEHLRQSFFADEPLNKAVELCRSGEGHEELERHCVDTILDGLSIMAVENDEIMGVALNGVLKPGDTNSAIKKLKTIGDEKYRKIFTLLYNRTEKLDLFSKYPVDKILECRIMSVGAKARGKGLAGELMRRSIQTAKDNGFKLFKGDATGKFSQRICLKYGMELIDELFYDEYLDPQTKLPVFDVPEPHKSLMILILKLGED